jgi:regulatory protein YycH of two-component signal transduction system YycFG
MRYENIKSVILTILVLLSIVLTWNLWTYQPDYETMKNSNVVAEVSISEKQEVQKIIRPDEVLYHIQGQHYGTTNSTELEKVIKQMSLWSFNSFKNYTGKMGNVNDLAHANGNVELIFPGEVPISLYRSVLNFEDRRLPDFNFDRIIINVENSEKDNGIVYFVSSERQQIFMSHISTTFLKEFERNFYKNAVSLPRYFSYKSSSNRTIFLPEGETIMMEYKYLPVTLDSEIFKEALFSDPSFVQKSFVPQGEEYTNGSSKMNVFYDTNMLSYVNPTIESGYSSTAYDLVKKSIDFVNEHGGWTDPYRYVSKDEKNQTVIFRLYSLEGFPVFNDKGVSEIKEVWGKNEINKYVRPDISMELPLKSETQKLFLPSGHEALKLLQSKKGFNPELLKEMVLGYRMNRDEVESKLIVLEPAWFYLYNNKWGEIASDDMGGLKHGLE